MRLLIGRLKRWIGIPLLAVVLAVTLLALTTGLAVHVYGGMVGPIAADVIIILGGGVQDDGRPTTSMARRVARAAALYNTGYAPALICTGGTPIPRPVTEAAACAEVLAANGVPATAIWLEEISRSTEENAIYAGQIMRQQDWGSALIVSDRYHLLRASVVFQQHDVPVAGLVGTRLSGSWRVTWEEYLWLGLRREVMALFWQGFKTFWRLPYTYMPYF